MSTILTDFFVISTTILALPFLFRPRKLFQLATSKQLMIKTHLENLKPNNWFVAMLVFGRIFRLLSIIVVITVVSMAVAEVPLEDAKAVVMGQNPEGVLARLEWLNHTSTGIHIYFCVCDIKYLKASNIFFWESKFLVEVSIEKNIASIQVRGQLQELVVNQGWPNPSHLERR